MASGEALLALAWLLGVALLGTRLACQVGGVRSLVGSATFEIHDAWREAFDAVARESRLAGVVRLGHSAAVEVPTVVGWLAPVVLVPLSPYAALSTEQLRALLAHELAHITRRDYLVNVLQKAAESLLFFHPAAWWLSHQIRAEREYCCDDAAVRTEGNALAYARALSDLEALRAERRQLAIGSNGGVLMFRIKRLLGLEVKARRTGRLAAFVVAALVASSAVGFAVVNDANAEPSAGAGPAADKPIACFDIGSNPNAPKPVGPDEVIAAKAAGCLAVGVRLSCDEVGMKLADLVQAGQITKEQANQKLSGCTNDQVKRLDLTCEALPGKATAIIANGGVPAPGALEVRATSCAPVQKLSCEQIGEKLQDLVQRGEMTAEQRAEKLAGCKDGPVFACATPFGQGAAGVENAGSANEPAGTQRTPCVVVQAERAAVKLTCDEVAARLGAMVTAGEITQAQADAKVAACTSQPEPPAKPTCAMVAEKLAEMVASGVATQEQADRKLAGCVEPPTGG